MRRYRVAVIEQSAVISEGLRTIFGGGEFEVVYVDSDIRGLIGRFAPVAPDVVIVNSALACGMPNNIRSAYPDFQDVALVALATTVCDDDMMRQFDGVVNIYDTVPQIVKKLHSAVEQSQTNPYSDSHELSDRERDVLILVARGMANKEIAEQLNISVHTVMSHRKNITHKTGIKSVAGLTVYALLNNLLDQNDINI